MTHPAPPTLPPECIPLARYRKGDEEYVVLATLDGSAGPRAVCHAVKSDVVVTFLSSAFYGNAALALARTSPAINTQAEVEALRNEVARVEAGWAGSNRALERMRADMHEILRACTYPGSHQIAVAGEAPVEKVKRALERIAGERDRARAARDYAQAQRCQALAAADAAEKERDVLRARIGDVEQTARLAMARATDRERERDDLEKRLGIARDVERETRESLARVRSERDRVEGERDAFRRDLEAANKRDASPTRKPLSEDEAVDLLDATTDRHQAAFDLLARGGRLVPGPFAVEDVRRAALACGASEGAVDAALRLLGRSL